MKVKRAIIFTAAGLVAAGVTTYLLRKKARSGQARVQPVVRDSQAIIRNVMHKSKEAHS